MNSKKILHELKHHLPFTALATLIAVLITLIILYILKQEISEQAFHILHPLHVIFSALVTGAMFYIYKKNIFQALLIGITGSIIVGSLSDIIFPYLGGVALNLQTSFHLPIIEKPFLILISALCGSSIGIATKITKIPHFIHVFLSVFASLFYILAFSQAFNTLYFIGVFFIVFIAVIIPCCISDIIFPFLFLKEKIKKCKCLRK